MARPKARPAGGAAVCMACGRPQFTRLYAVGPSGGFPLCSPCVGVIVYQTGIPRAKGPDPALTRQQADIIRHRYMAGMTQRALAKEYGVSHSVITSVVNWRTPYTEYQI